MQSSIRFVAYFVVGFFLSLAGCEQWEPLNNTEAIAKALHEEEKAMSMSPVTAADYGGSLPLASISCPDAGEKVKAEHIRAPVAALLAETDDIRSLTAGLESDKVDRAGDTMTGTLTINASAPNSQALYAVGNGTFPAIYALGGASGKAAIFDAGTNQDAVLATGNGTGFGVRGIGGASGGGGGRFEATASGTMGISAVGASGGGSGIVATGGTGGPGAEVYPGTAQTGTTAQMGVYAEGYLYLGGTQINAFVDPGADNALHGGNIPKARGRAFLGGAPPFTFIGTPYGFTSTITVTGLGTTRYTMIRPMADTNYEVHAQIHGAVGYAVAETNIAGRTTTSFELTVFSTTTGTPGVGAAEYLDILVMGKQ